MTLFLALEQINDTDRQQVGGKALALAALVRQGIRVPKTYCVPCRVYGEYLSATRLKAQLLLEINRKPIQQMRWEEIWDISLRIRNLFLTTPLPEPLGQKLSLEIRTHFGNLPIAVRSSAPAEDGKTASFAGVHDSFLNVWGDKEILKHIRLVWASLYSDSALLYRKELGLDIHTSAMAVLLQELIPSDSSGVFFNINPLNSNESVLEAVYGLNQGLVDGEIDPDRWTMDRASGKILHHDSPERDQYAMPDRDGVCLVSLPQSLANHPPLDEPKIARIWETGKRVETLFGRPQDMEWTFFKNDLVVLQARPVTTSGFKETDDKRAWYLTLHRSYENLKKLYTRIEHRLIPEMIQQAADMGQVVLTELTHEKLANEIRNRQKIYDHWVKVYWADFIPFAHGIRLFGQVYNDAVQPEDAYEFMGLLEKTHLKSIHRNHLLQGMADLIRQDSDLKHTLVAGETPGPGHPFMICLQDFISEFGDLACQTMGASECQQGNAAIIRLVLEFSKSPPKTVSTKANPDKDALRHKYLNCFSPDKQRFAREVLQLGRESYRLRDDDNLHLGRIEARLAEAVQEGQLRLAETVVDTDTKCLAALPALSLPPEIPAAQVGSAPPERAPDPWLKARQIVGHPAGPGIARGSARVIRTPQDLLEYKQGEVLICQGVDPNMTFVVPLAAAVVEERGGMLIHGAIIAREYGLPCVTGAARSTQLIHTGDQVTVDGYLGIVTCDTGALDS